MKVGSNLYTNIATSRYKAEVAAYKKSLAKKRTKARGKYKLELRDQYKGMRITRKLETLPPYMVKKVYVPGKKEPRSSLPPPPPFLPVPKTHPLYREAERAASLTFDHRSGTSQGVIACKSARLSKLLSTGEKTVSLPKRLRQESLRNVSLRGVIFEGKLLSKCDFYEVDFSECIFDRCFLNVCRFVRCRFDGVTFRGSGFGRCRFLGCVGADIKVDACVFTKGWMYACDFPRWDASTSIADGFKMRYNVF